MLPERQWIERVRRLSRTSGNRALVHGIGDDCAVLALPHDAELLVTTDLCIEDVHFRRAWHSPRSVGHRCLVRGLSDIAAMGGEPLACFLSLGVPDGLPHQWTDEFMRGLLQLGRSCGAPLAGGDLSRSQKIVADIVVLGKVPRGRALLRSGAQPGDRIYVTGTLGGAAAELKRLSAKKKSASLGTRPHVYPLPRLKTGQWLRKSGLATAMIDLSDGLSVDLAHICRESRVSALIDARSIPVAKGADLHLALHGGEDYELLFTAPESANVPERIAGVPVTRIGKVSRSSPGRIEICGPDGKKVLLRPQGWQHFTKN